MEPIQFPGVSFMRTALFLKTYKGDHEWLPYCLRSIQKFCSGYTGVHVVSEDVNEVRPVVEQFGFTFHPVPRPDYSGYLQQQVLKMNADKFTKHDDTHVLFTDTDSIFIEPNTPDTWCVDGKPRLVVNTFDYLRRQGINVPWQGPTQRVLHFRCPYETMRCQPLIFSRATVRGCREYCESRNKRTLDDYVRTIRHAWGSFSEFNIIGNYAMKFHRNQYHVIDYDLGYYEVPHAKQYGFRLTEGNSVTPARREFLEKVLA